LSLLAKAPRDVVRLIGGVVVLMAVTGLLAAIALLLQSDRYRAVMVVVPVAGPRTGLSLPGGVANLLGSAGRGSSGDFEATPEVIRYLLRSRSVLMTIGRRPFREGTLASALTGATADAEHEEVVLREFRKELRVTTDPETGFVSVSTELADSALARALVGEAIGETSRVFRQIAQAQATELLQAQDLRLDSANAGLRRAESRLLEFDLQNRVVPDRSRLSMERARLSRQVDEAVQVQQLVQTDRQGAIARQLEQAAAVAIVEGLPESLPRRSKRILFRSGLLALAVGTLLGVAIASVKLLRGYQP